MVHKVAPYLPESDHFDAQESLSETDIDDLANWGFNLVRLGIIWESVETAPGVFNETMLANVNKMVTALGEKGVYTLIDIH